MSEKMRCVPMVSSARPSSSRCRGLRPDHRRYTLPFARTHPGLLQNFIWQEYDTAPEFPVLKRFLDFWTREIDGLLHSVTIAHCGLIRPAEFKAIDGVLQLH